MSPARSERGAIELRGLTKRFDDVVAVDSIDATIEGGEFFSLLGPSGCGKTTTLRMIAGFETPSMGAIRVDGADITHVPAHKRDMGMVFQNYALFPHRTVAENVAFGLRMRGMEKPAIAAKVKAALAMVELSGLEDRRPAQLSGGQQQRVALARAIVIEPRVLLCDEPLGALDKKLRQQMQFELKQLQKTLGLTLVFVTHDQEEALSIADRLGVMNHGELQQVGTPEEVYLRPRTRFVASFLGAMNWIGEIGVRPEAMRIGRHRPTEDARPATVVHTTFLGNCVHIEARLSDGQLVVAEVSRRAESFAAGDAVHVWWEPQDELRFE